MITSSEPDPVELLKFPHPYQAAFTVASDIDSANLARFRGVHALFCGRELIPLNSPEWNALGLTTDCHRYDRARAGVTGLGLDFADSFFLVGDPTTFGMYRYAPESGCFREDIQGDNCADFIRRGIRDGSIDSYHTFLGYERREIEPMLRNLFEWCEKEGAIKPRVWINHSTPAAPTGLCPDRLQPNRIELLARLTARKLAGRLLGRPTKSFRSVFARYQGDKPGSPYYVNDLLAANGLRYVWLNANSFCGDRISLPEQLQNGRSTILEPVTMDDGVRYYQFKRCFGVPQGGIHGIAYLKDSEEGFDTSVLINEKSLGELCASAGTCILYTHWTHWRSVPLANKTIERFELLQKWRNAGRIWLTTTARLLEWTRRRTFLKVSSHRQGKELTVKIEGVDDPVFGHETLSLRQLDGLCLRLQQPEVEVRFVINERPLSPQQFHRVGQICWLDSKGAPGGSPIPEAETAGFAF